MELKLATDASPRKCIINDINISMHHNLHSLLHQCNSPNDDLAQNVKQETNKETLTKFGNNCLTASKQDGLRQNNTLLKYIMGLKTKST
jgi:hypothetical protein